MFNSWDKNDPKDAQVILEMLRRGTYQRYVDPQIAGHHDLQELAKTYHQVSRARTKVQHSLINHSLPLYIPEMHHYWCTSPQRMVRAFSARVSDTDARTFSNFHKIDTSDSQGSSQRLLNT
ncbi:hypothetical protein AQ727_17315 [Burkholderia pseudomallei]|uniref:IS110 family transposase n=1 Tax=Burkholderia pseudomallei TaxID=28450 RepID=UPI0009B5A238|nr:transposase [Burkholderia pseudomallei]OMR77009.1 hypothetical protein AQ727_17315 [Burkholderia pseudomallei]